MSQKVSVVLVDDIDESEASETIAFALDGSSYEIDLNDGHAAELRDALAPWIGAARRSSGSSSRRGTTTARRGSSTGGGSSADRERTQQIREWARANGHTVSDRGRLSTTVIAAYEA
ncbi:MAG: hypothetical protein JWL64_1027, partial [Frankiales bacterium]|nr:hypothetical protein [Frankiales bacterium]